MVLKIFIACIVAYYLFLFIRYRDGFKPSRRDRDERDSADSPVTENSIVGKSTYRTGHFKTIPDVSGQGNPDKADETNNADTFVPSGQVGKGAGTEVDDYLNPEELEAIDLYPEGIPFTAEGVTFEEMEHAAKVLRKDTDTEENERQALHTLAVIERTALYSDIVDGIDLGRLRVAEMMQKYDMPFDPPDEMPTDIDLSGFSLNNYM